MDFYRKTGKWAVLLTADMRACMIGGCGGKEPAPSAATPAETSAKAEESTGNPGMPNPMEEVDDVLAFEKIGVHMVLPEEAVDSSYFIINGEVADIHFTFNDIGYTYRASDTAEDFAGIFERFKDGVINETAGSGGQVAEIQIKTTESGGRLAAWEWGSTKYTLYTASQVEDGEISSLAVTLAELGENEK